MIVIWEINTLFSLFVIWKEESLAFRFISILKYFTYCQDFVRKKSRIWKTLEKVIILSFHFLKKSNNFPENIKKYSET